MSTSILDETWTRPSETYPPCVSEIMIISKEKIPNRSNTCIFVAFLNFFIIFLFESPIWRQIEVYLKILPHYRYQQHMRLKYSTMVFHMFLRFPVTSSRHNILCTVIPSAKIFVILVAPITGYQRKEGISLTIQCRKGQNPRGYDQFFSGTQFFLVESSQ